LNSPDLSEEEAISAVLNQENLLFETVSSNITVLNDLNSSSIVNDEISQGLENNNYLKPNENTSVGMLFLRMNILCTTYHVIYL
jgi:hypothetical protein